jgi:hypothetical protein
MDGALRHVADVGFALALIGVAVVAIIRPVVILRWAKRAHPGLAEDDRAALWVARLVGIGGLGVALFFSLIVLRSLSQP